MEKEKRERTCWNEGHKAFEYPQFRRKDTAQVIDFAIIGGGLTGVSAAYHIIREYPKMSVFLLEANHIGSGLSGKFNGIFANFAERNFNEKLTINELREAKDFHQSAMKYTREIIEMEEIECDFEKDKQLITNENNVQLEFETFQSLGVPCAVSHDTNGNSDLSFLCDHVNPIKLVQELASIASKLGVRIFEHSKVRKLKQTGPPILKINGEELVAKVVIVATNAFTPSLDLLNNYIMPIQTENIVTEPLTDEQLSKFSISTVIMDKTELETLTVFVTKDNRLFASMNKKIYHYKDKLPPIDAKFIENSVLPRVIKKFPELYNIKVDYAWTSEKALTGNMRPTIGRNNTDDEDCPIFYAVGFHDNMALSVLYGRLIKEILEDETSDELSFAIKNKKAPWLGPSLFRYLEYRSKEFSNEKKYLIIAIFVLLVLSLLWTINII